MEELGHLFARWIHYFAGVIWIGLLYFFNFVNANLQKNLSPEVKKEVNPGLLLRTLYWFRMGAALTWLSGVYMLWALGYFAKFSNGMAGPGTKWMAAAFLFGTIMAFNVWFIIWPRQKRLVGKALGGADPREKDAPQAALASKINTFLSMPLLLGMIMGPHGGAAFNGTFLSDANGWTGVIIGTVIGLAFVKLLYIRAAKVPVDKV